MHDDYKDGVRDGRIKAVEDNIKEHASKIKSHGQRITAQERISYGILGALLFIEALPTIRGILE